MVSFSSVGVFFVLLVFLRFPGGASQRVLYRAAVFEHEVNIPTESAFITVSRRRAVFNMMKNLNVYKTQARIAASKKAKILVFPEDGVYGMLFTRQTIKPYLEYIPDPRHVTWNPCLQPSRFSRSDVQRVLSCMARENRIYVVANVGDRQPCEGVHCPADGQRQYNTDVVYDDAGTLIARYHKTHLYEEWQFDRPNETEFVTFDTPFGKFGVFTCYDILFKEPAVDLAKRYNVTNIVFPTAWIDVLPQLASIGFHSAFARGMGVNLLAANLHVPSFRMHGSGIYTPRGAAAFYYDLRFFSGGRLLVSDVRDVHGVDTRDDDVDTSDLLDRTKYLKTKQASLASNDYSPPHYKRSASFEGRSRRRRLQRQILKSRLEERVQRTVKTDVRNERSAKTYLPRLSYGYQWKTLTTASGHLVNCFKKTCCSLTYKMQPDRNVRELYAFGVFDGYDAERYTQICTLVKCPFNSVNSCGRPALWADTRFEYLNLTGQFSTSYTFPEVLVAERPGVGLDSLSWVFENRSIVVKNGTRKPVLSASLLTRVYSRDRKRYYI